MADQLTADQLLDRLEARYRFRFAGHARVSRDPELLDEMLAELDQVAQKAGDDSGIAERITTSRELFKKEQAAIIEARSVAGAVQAHRLRLWGELLVGRYRRNFAGKSRFTRDVKLLDEIRVALGEVRDELSTMSDAAPHLDLAPAVQLFTRTSQLAVAEGERIREARLQGSHEDQGTRFAELANEQFRLYQEGFAGQPRLSRHPPRLERVVAALEEIGANMARLQRAGFDSSHNDRNLGIVTERMSAYRKELAQMSETREQAELKDRVGSLGGAANRIFEHYRQEFAGKSRSEANANLLNDLIERLFAISKEMDVIDEEDGDELNERNLALVLDQLVMYQREWDAIREAAGNGPAPA